MVRKKKGLIINGLNDFSKRQKLKARLQISSESVVTLRLWNIQDNIEMSEESSYSSDSSPMSPMLFGQRTSSEEDDNEQNSAKTGDSLDAIDLQPLEHPSSNSGSDDKFSWDQYFSCESVAHDDNDDPVWKRIKNPKPSSERIQRNEYSHNLNVSSVNDSTYIGGRKEFSASKFTSGKKLISKALPTQNDILSLASGKLLQNEKFTAQNNLSSTNEIPIAESLIHQSKNESIKKRLGWSQSSQKCAKNQLIVTPKESCENDNQDSPTIEKSDKTSETGEFKFKVPQPPNLVLKATPMGDVQPKDLRKKNLKRVYKVHRPRNYDNSVPNVGWSYNTKANSVQGKKTEWGLQKVETNKVKSVGWCLENVASVPILKKNLLLNTPPCDNFVGWEAKRVELHPSDVGQDAVVPSNSPNITKSSNVNYIDKRVQIFESSPNENAVVPGDIRFKTALILQNQVVPTEKSYKSQTVSTHNPTTVFTADNHVLPVKEVAATHSHVLPVKEVAATHSQVLPGKEVAATHSQVLPVKEVAATHSQVLPVNEVAATHSHVLPVKEVAATHSQVLPVKEVAATHSQVLPVNEVAATHSHVLPVKEVSATHYTSNTGNFQIALQSAFAENFQESPKSPDKSPCREFTQNKTSIGLPIPDSPSKGCETSFNIAEIVQIASSHDKIAQSVDSLQESSNVQSDNLASIDTLQMNRNRPSKMKKPKRRCGFRLSTTKRRRPITLGRTDTDFRPMSKETKLIIMDELISELAPTNSNIQDTPVQRVKRAYRKKMSFDKNLTPATPQNTAVRYVTRSVAKSNQTVPNQDNSVTKVAIPSEEIAAQVFSTEPLSVGSNENNIVEYTLSSEGTNKTTEDERPILSIISHQNEQANSETGPSKESIKTNDFAGKPSCSNNTQKDDINFSTTKISHKIVKKTSIREKKYKDGESQHFQIANSDTHKTKDTNITLSVSSQNVTNLDTPVTDKYFTRSSIKKEKALKRQQAIALLREKEKAFKREKESKEVMVISSPSDQREGSVHDKNSEENSVSDCPNCSSSMDMDYSDDSNGPNWTVAPVLDNKSNRSNKKSTKLSSTSYDELFSKLETAYNKQMSLKGMKYPELKNEHLDFQKLNVEKVALSTGTPLSSEFKALFTYDFNSIIKNTKISTNTKHAFFNHEGEDALKIFMTSLWMKNLKYVVSYEKKKLEEYEMGKTAQGFIERMCDSLITTGTCDNYLCKKDHEMGKNFCLSADSMWQTSYFFLSKASNPHLKFCSSVLNWLGDKKSLGKIFVLAEIFYKLVDQSPQEKFQLWDNVVRGIIKCGMSDWEAMLCLVSYFYNDDHPEISWNFMKTCLKIHKKSIEMYWKILMNLASLGFLLEISSIIYLVEIITVSYTFQSQESSFILANQVQTLDLPTIEENLIALKKFDKILESFLQKISPLKDTSETFERIRNMEDLGRLLEKTFPSKVLPRLLISFLNKKSVRFMRHLRKFLRKNKMKKGLEAIGRVCLSLLAEFRKSDKLKRASKMLKLVNKKFKIGGLKPLNETDETDQLDISNIGN